MINFLIGVIVFLLLVIGVVAYKIFNFVTKFKAFK